MIGRMFVLRRRFRSLTEEWCGLCPPADAWNLHANSDSKDDHFTVTAGNSNKKQQ